MLDTQTKNLINSARDILVGKIPDPKGQIEQITNALIYKFMDDQDRESQKLGGKASFFTERIEKYAWHKLFDSKLQNRDRAMLYTEGIEILKTSKHLPPLFQAIFKDAYLPFRADDTIALFLNEINKFNYDNSETLGNAFEYLLSIMGAQGDAGQFRTPRHIIKFIVDVVQPKKDEIIFDPACGTAGFLIEAYKYIKNNEELSSKDKQNLGTNIIGIDIDPTMAKLSRVNLYLHGFKTPKITENDTLTNESLWQAKKYNCILANPPFMTPKGGIQPHEKFTVQAKRSEVLFVGFIAEHLRLEGRAGIIVPEGIIFQAANAYKNLRKHLVEDWGLYAVVSLPNGVFQPYSGVKTSILFLDRRLKTADILFLKVENDGFDLGAQRRPIDKNDLPDALNILREYQNTPSLRDTPLKEEINTPSSFHDATPLKEGNNSPSVKGWQAKPDGVVKWNELPFNPKLKHRARELRKAGNLSEVLFWQKVKNKQLLGLDFDRQKIIGNYIVDFYCKNLGVVVEVDGSSHDNKQEYDKIRDEYLESLGLKVIHITDVEVKKNMNGVLDYLQKVLNTSLANASTPLKEGEHTPSFQDTPLKEEINTPSSFHDATPLKEGNYSPSMKGWQAKPDGVVRIPKNQIAQTGEYNLTGDRYIETQDYKNAKWDFIKIGDLFQSGRGRVISKKYIQENIGKYPVYSSQTTNNGILGLIDTYDFEGEYLTWTTDGANAGKVFYRSEKFNCTNVCGTLKLKKEFGKLVNLKYVAPILDKITYKYVVKVGNPKLMNKEMGRIKIPLPPLEVQEQIVAEIDQWQKVIDGAKQVIANYKPSFRIDPEWEMVELGEVCEKIFAGGDVPKADYSKQKTEDYKIPIFSNGIEEKSLYGYTNISKVNKPSVTLSARGTIGYPVIRNVSFYPVIRLIVLTPKENLLSNNFLGYILKITSIENTGNSIPQLTVPMVKKIKIPLPPLEIQKQIVAEIEAEQKIVNANKNLIEKMEQKIERKIGEVWNG